MPNFLIILSILTPFLGAFTMTQPWFAEKKQRERSIMAFVVATSIITLLLVAYPPQSPLKLFKLTDHVNIAFQVDGLSRVFALLVALLWPLTTLYAFDYMQHEGGERRFFGFFLIAYGIVLGIAFAATMVTMYLFFELLTLATLPLVMHKMDDKARFAGFRYLLYSMIGAALGLISVIFLSVYSDSDFFLLGGMLNSGRVVGMETILQMIFVVSFFGFGVKAALFPGHAWLPIASVAPTPVTALLHAVAVVKAGVFACIRLVYYGFGTDFLLGSGAQDVIMAATVITIVFGSIMALRSDHFKRRLAYSTISNLSYIMFGVSLMSGAGLKAASLHMLYHGVIKITLFFCAGAVYAKTGWEYISRLSGLAAKMPVTFATFTLASLALMGIPPLPGFWSKLALGNAAAELGTKLSYLGLGAIMLSALLTALYQMGVVLQAYFPTEVQATDKAKPRTTHRQQRSPRYLLRVARGAQSDLLESKRMNLVLLVLCCLILIMGFGDGFIERWLSQILMLP